MRKKKSADQVKGGSEQSDDPENDQGRWKKWKVGWANTHIANKAVAIGTTVAAVATVVYAFVASFQLAAFRESNRITRDSLVAVQRAFIAFKKMGYEHHIVGGDKGNHDVFVFWSDIENVGNTPSRPIAQSFNGGKTGAEPNESSFIGAGVTSSVVLPPKTPTTLGRGSLPFSDFFGAQTPQSVQSVRTTQIAPGDYVYLWGWITYRDAFPNTPIRLTEWCQSVYSVSAAPSPPNSGTPLIYSIDFSDCPHHNCNDKDCTDYDEITTQRPK